jgi:hypothetical protein
LRLAELGCDDRRMNALHHLDQRLFPTGGEGREQGKQHVAISLETSARKYQLSTPH